MVLYRHFELRHVSWIHIAEELLDIYDVFDKQENVQLKNSCRSKNKARYAPESILSMELGTLLNVMDHEMVGYWEQASGETVR